ncbi:MAG TPA: hypothetical protein VII06_18375 [Chloroflexota bacterium]|jgi:hypothetical protein
MSSASEPATFVLTITGGWSRRHPPPAAALLQEHISAQAGRPVHVAYCATSTRPVPLWGCYYTAHADPALSAEALRDHLTGALEARSADLRLEQDVRVCVFAPRGQGIAAGMARVLPRSSRPAS